MTAEQIRDLINRGYRITQSDNIGITEQLLAKPEHTRVEFFGIKVKQTPEVLKRATVKHELGNEHK